MPPRAEAGGARAGGIALEADAGAHGADRYVETRGGDALTAVAAGSPAEAPFVGSAGARAAARGEPALPQAPPAPPSPLLPRLAWPLTSEDELATAAAGVHDWPGFLEQARRQNLLGLLASRLVEAKPATVPKDVLSELTRVRRAMNRFGLQRSGQLLRILESLRCAGIAAMPIKGPALSQDLYGDPTLRAFCDLDLVVRPEDAPAARAVLLGVGFHDAHPYNERVVSHCLESESELGLVGPAGSPVVDLHWRVTSAFSPRSIAADRLLRGARSLAFLAHHIPAPGVEDQLLLGAFHGGFYDWQPLELRVAVALQVTRVPDDGWPRIIESARQVGSLRRLLAGVAHSSALFSLPLPVAVEALLKADPITGHYLDYLRLSAARSAGSEATGQRGGSVAYPLWRAASEDTLSDALKHLVRALMPGPSDWGEVDLSPGSEGLYWLVRPVRLLRKYTRAAPGRGR